MSSRRDFLRLALGGAAAMSLPGPAWAAPTKPAPDFARLHATEPNLVGVRPYRKGGVRLELGPPLQAPGGPKQVVHNYGHSGGGITLSMGCAEDASILTYQARIRSPGRRVAVIGSGIIGLTTAAAIRRSQRDVEVTIYAADLSLQSTTSWVAGGQFEPSGLRREYTDPASRARLAGWLRTAKRELLAARDRWDALGFAERDNYTLEHDNGGFDEITPRDVIPAHEPVELPFPQLRVPGRRYRTWLLNPRRWMPALVADLQADGVRFVERRFESLRDVAALDENVVVNCTGYGARALFGDDALIPMRGHLVRLERPSPEHDYFFSGGCENKVIAYVFCRQDDIVVGGTFLPEDARTEIVAEDAAVFSGLVENGRRLFAGRPRSCAWLPQAR